MDHSTTRAFLQAHVDLLIFKIQPSSGNINVLLSMTCKEEVYACQEIILQQLQEGQATGHLTIHGAISTTESNLAIAVLMLPPQPPSLKDPSMLASMKQMMEIRSVLMVQQGQTVVL